MYAYILFIPYLILFPLHTSSMYHLTLFVTNYYSNLISQIDLLMNSSIIIQIKT